VKLSPRRRLTNKKQLDTRLTRRWRVTLERLEDRVMPDVSAPPILQWFEGSYNTIENRAPDIFNAGYGGVWTPPSGRADSGNTSVGYDQYDRYDLGSPGNATLYGTQAGMKAMINGLHQAAVNYYADLVWNHDGFSQWGTVDGSGNTFVNAGGYPGFVMSVPSNQWGDFHSPYDNSGTHGQLAGLIDIAHENNYQYVRSPVPGNPNDLPAGVTPAFGRLANVPQASNSQYYPDQSLQPILLYDPTTGEQNIHVYPFNLANPMNGTPTTEDALGYLMRYAQWMVQVMGVDGFRLDAAKNMDPWVLNYYDRAVYRSSFRTLLDGSQPNIFSFGEVYDGNTSFVQQYIRKDINPQQPGTIGGDRDALDFPLYFAMQTYLSGNGFQNDWGQIVNASQDIQDDGYANNGSQGVAFVSNQDTGPPYLGNVAYAYTLMRPGNAIVYFNGHEFGPNRSFPLDGRGDALGGLYGNIITTLVNIRDTHPMGNYIQRDLEKETLIFERDNSLLFAGSNRLDSGYDSRTVQTDFAPGTPLIDLTGNAANPALDPYGDIPSLLVVNGDGTVNLRVPRNVNEKGVETDMGYLIYGLSGPQGQVSIANVDHVIPGGTPTSSTNGTTELSPIDVITGNTFNVELDTNAVNLLGFYRDQPADGDNALVKIDGGIDVNGNGVVDNTTPGTVQYGFENFTTVNSPGYYNTSGNGQYIQTIDATKLSNGLHYITVRAFRHRSDNGPPVFTDFKQAIYIEHTPPVVAIAGLAPIVAGVNENQQLTVQSTDERANSVHVFIDQPASLTNAQIEAMVSSSNQATQTDRNLFTYNFYGLTNGNHVFTVVAYDMAGGVSVSRFPGFYTSTIYGSGLGDLNFDGQVNSTDITLFNQVLTSNNTQFNPAADMNGDGVVNNSDLILLYPRLQAVGASAATFAAYNNLLGPPAAGFSLTEGNTLTFSVNQPSGTGPTLSFGWSLNNDNNFNDAVGANATLTWAQLGALGVSDDGLYPVTLLVSDGVNSDKFNTTLSVSDVSVQATGGLTVSATEGATSGSQAVATFTDPAGAQPVGDYTATMTWGDGNVSSGTVTVSNNVFTVSGANTYAEEGTYSVSVSITDGGAPASVVTSTAKVADAVPIITAATISPFEGAAFSNLTVATFTDNGTLSDFTAKITWGDGTTSTGTIVAGTGNTFLVQGSHTYAEEGTYTKASVKVTDVGGKSASVSEKIKVADAGLTSTGTTIQAVQNRAFTGVVASFTDADPAGAVGDYKATIQWGDGHTSSGTIQANGSSFTVTGTNTYAKTGTFVITVTITDAGGAKTSVKSKATVTAHAAAIAPPPAADDFWAAYGRDLQLQNGDKK
jgi:hypothetical protein